MRVRERCVVVAPTGTEPERALSWSPAVPDTGTTETRMIERRPFNALGGADHGWLKAKHHFSFAGYSDATRMSRYPLPSSA